MTVTSLADFSTFNSPHSSTISPKILCVGDFMLDLFIEGSVDRISPEGPIPVLKEKRRFFALGGSGNVVRNLSALEVDVFAVGIIDCDFAGKKTQDLLNELPNVTSHLLSVDKWSTPFKTRFSSQGQQLLRFDQEQSHSLEIDQENFLLDSIDSLLPKTDVVILSDYDKGLLSDRLCQAVIEKASKLNKPVIVDPKGHDYSKYKGATLLTPNFSELKATTSKPLHSHDSIAKAAFNLKEKVDAEMLLVTLGAEGMMLIRDENNIVHIPSKAREVFDVSGAGDTVIATLAFAMSKQMSMEDAVILANKAGGIVVGKVGTAVIHLDELLGDDHQNSEQDKIVTLTQAVELAHRWRRQGCTIGFTNGCFDLLHLGHLHLLRQCKSQCDRLILGLNTDASIKRLKGEERPIQNEYLRSHILSALELVDAVVLFEDDTPLNLISHILPDVLIKGSDYQVNQVVGADIVLKNGGRVYLAELKDGYSTTSTVKKLKAAGEKA